MGYTENEDDTNWRAMPLTQEHKPECNIEKSRIINAGGKVITKSGVPRVVWNRPRIGKSFYKLIFYFQPKDTFLFAI